MLGIFQQFLLTVPSNFASTRYKLPHLFILFQVGGGSEEFPAYSAPQLKGLQGRLTVPPVKGTVPRARLCEDSDSESLIVSLSKDLVF